MRTQRKSKAKPKATRKPKATSKRAGRKASPKPKAHKKPGPKLKIASKGVVKALVDAISDGNTIETACHLAGISKSVYFNYIKTGEDDKEAGKKTVFVEFVESTAHARAKGQSFLVSKVREAVSEDWRAGAFLLTHGPEKSAWAEKSKLEIGGDPDAPLKVETKPLTTDEWMAKYHEAVAAAAAEPEVVEAPGKRKERKEG